MEDIKKKILDIIKNIEEDIKKCEIFIKESKDHKAIVISRLVNIVRQEHVDKLKNLIKEKFNEK